MVAESAGQGRSVRLRRSVVPVWSFDVAVLGIGRTAALLLGVGYLLGVGELDGANFVGVLLAVGFIATTVDLVAPRQKVTPVLEALTAGVILGVVGSAGDFFLPYLAIPGIAAGLRAGPAWGLLTSLSGVAAFAAASVSRGNDWVSAATWGATAAAAGLLAGWVYSTRRQRRPLSESARYEEATRLLEQLRPLLRPMAGGLDARPLASRLLEEISEDLPDRSMAVAICGRGTPRIVATTGELPGHGWHSLAVAAGRQRLSPSSEPRARVFPVRDDAGYLTAALMVDGDSELTRQETRSITQRLEAWTSRLLAASLFDEVRDMATLAERSRLAREMHDSVAQDIASLGYLVDDLQDTVDSDTAIKLGRLREEIGRVVAELRLSIHDLRAEGLLAGGLGGAIAEIARRETRAADCIVHLRLQETRNMLPSDIETELVRIAQEALVNVRRHAAAQNVWVSSVVGPGGAVVTIEDDGRGIHPTSASGIGMQSMTERAVRIGALISFEPRAPSGTVVRVELPQSEVVTIARVREALDT